MTEYEAASEQVLTVMEDLLSANLILAVMGFVCALFNVPLIYVLLASPKLRHDAKVKVINLLSLPSTFVISLKKSETLLGSFEILLIAHSHTRCLADYVPGVGRSSELLVVLFTGILPVHTLY